MFLRKRQAHCACIMEYLEARLLLDGTVAAAEPLAGVTLGAAELQVGGLAAPPPGYSYSPSESALAAGGISKVLDVPEYFWYRGCGPTSVAMVLGYWDGLAYPDYFPGLADTQTNAVNRRIASLGHDADWWPQPDRQPPPDYHSDDSIADFFKTSRGSLKKGWSWGEYADDVFNNYSNYVGYSAGQAFIIPWGIDSGFTLWAFLRTEIDAGRPAMFLVDSNGDDDTDHFIPVIGYRTEPSWQYAAYTTWEHDPGVHWFNWNPVSTRLWGISFGTFFQPSAASADLAGTRGDIVGRTALIWGDAFTYDFAVKNYGTNNAGDFSINYYLSNDTDIGPSDYYLGTTYVSSLGAGASASGSQALSLPSTPPAGFSWEDDVWVGMVVDANGDVAEGVESNNRNLGLHKDYDHVRVDGKPDLVGTDFSLDYGILNNNRGSVKATFTVTNAGRGSTVNGFYVAFYLSQNTTVSTGDRYLVQRWVSTLDAGESYTSTLTLTPGRTDRFAGDGTYTLGMVIDYDGLIAEANEGNNANRGFGLDKAEANYGKKIFFADFEHGDGAMNIVNDTAWAPVDGLWHVELHRAFDAGHSETHSMYYGRHDPVNGDWDYDVGDSAGVFLTKRIELPDEPITLTFNYLAETSSSSSYDRMFVQVYNPDTGVFTTLLDKASGLEYDTAGAWEWAEVDLTSFRGKNVQLRFGFDSISSSDNNHEGWYVDDIAIWAVTNPVTVEAFRSLARDSDYYHEPSYIQWAADHDTFVFNEEQYDEYFTLTTDRQGSPVNPAIAVYDFETREMLYMDSGSGPGDDARVVLSNSGNWNSYLVEVWDTEEDSVGELDVHIDGSGMSGFGNLALNDAGDVSLTGTIDSANDTDYYRLVAPAQASGTLSISLTEISGDLRTRLQVWKDDDESPVAVRFADNGPEEATLTGVQPGDVFWVSVSDHTFGGTGDFELDVDFSTAVPGTLTQAEGFAYFHRTGESNDALSFNAYINGADDVDSYYFAGDTGWTGTYTITVNRLSGSVDPVVAVYDAPTGAQLAFDDDSGSGTGARVSLPLDGLRRYIVAVADATASQAG
ncbi:MAG: CARDB domain-containing protein, partial [Phycisphaerae bacterium]